MLYPNLLKTAAQLLSKDKDRAKVMLQKGRKRTMAALGGIGKNGVNSKCHRLQPRPESGYLFGVSAINKSLPKITNW